MCCNGEWAGSGNQGVQGKQADAIILFLLVFFRNTGKSDENPSGRNMIPLKMITKYHTCNHSGNHSIFILSDFLIIYILRNGWISAKGNISRTIRMELQMGNLRLELNTPKNIQIFNEWEKFLS